MLFNFLHFFIYSFYVYLKAFPAYYIASINFFLRIDYEKLDFCYDNYTYWTKKISKLDNNEERLFKTIVISMFISYWILYSVVYVFGVYYFLRSFYSFFVETIKLMYKCILNIFIKYNNNYIYFLYILYKFFEFYSLFMASLASCVINPLSCILWFFNMKLKIPVKEYFILLIIDIP